MIVIALTVLISALLLFLVQPILAKEILPWFGGSAAVWITCVAFFQVVLLLGYIYAHAVTCVRTRRNQILVHAVLVLASLSMLPVVPAGIWKPHTDADPTWHILGLLSTTVGLPYFLLSSTSPLLQKWLSRSNHDLWESRSLYRLFALSNFGSLIGLLAYPFVVEPYASASLQSFGWSAGYLLYCVGLMGCIWQLGQSTTNATTIAQGRCGTLPGEPFSPRPGAGLYAFWVVCAALGSILLLSITNHITQNVASIPFLWILPLTLYLLSFVIVFEGRGGEGWYNRRIWLLPIVVSIAAMSWGLGTHHAVLDVRIAIPLFSAGLFLGCVLCHGELALGKPGTAFLTQYYICIASGGAAGGLFVALVAPRIFNGYWETPLSLIGLALLASIQTAREIGPLTARRWIAMLVVGLIYATAILAASHELPVSLGAGTSSWYAWIGRGGRILCVALVICAVIGALHRRMQSALAVACLCCTLMYGWNYYRFLTQDTHLMVRDFYGTLRVKLTEPGPTQVRRLMHGVILHGEQFVAPDRSQMPTTYYGPRSGIGRAIRAFKLTQAPMRLGSIGLGTGTLAAYGKLGDVLRIYELDPEVLRVATHEFTYLSTSPAKIKVILGDARLSLEREVAAGLFSDPRQRFDILSIDAFSGDAIPVHLMTREALALYAQVIKPDGVIAFHVSNRFLDLAPVVAQISATQAFETLEIDDDPSDFELYSPSEWVLVSRNHALLAQSIVANGSHAIVPRVPLRMWTDQFNDLFQILR